MANIITTNNGGTWGTTWDMRSDPFRIFEEVLGRATRSTGRTTNTQVTEQGDSFQIDVVAPGLTRKDFNVKVKESGGRSVLTVSYTSDDTNTFTRGTFTRSWTLPRNITTDAVVATYRNGILTVTVPKTTTEQDNSEFVVSVK